jgi:hypothetical protein
MLMNSRAPHTMTCHCGWCGAVRRPDGTWDDEFDSEISQANVSQPNMSQQRAKLVTHGICPDCAAAFRADAAIDRRQQPRVEEVFLRGARAEDAEPRPQSAYLMASF